MDSHPHLMLTPDSAAHVDLVTDLAMPLIAAGGLGAVTPASIAERAGCSRQAVHQWFGSHVSLRHAVANRFAARWNRWVDVRVHFYGLLGLLPDSDDVRIWTRVWLALVEEGLRDATIANCVRIIRHTESDLIRAHVGSPAADTVQVLVEGLRWRAASEPGSGSEAFAAGRTFELLAAHLSTLRPALSPGGRHGGPSPRLLDDKQARDADPSARPGPS